MIEFNSWNENLQKECLTTRTGKNIILLTQPVFVHECKAYQVNSYNYEKLDDFINAVKSAPEKTMYFYSCNHYKEIAMKADEFLLLTYPSQAFRIKTVRYYLI